MYPEAIRIVRSEHNVGWRENYRRTIAAARGRYIAMLDGDDYFTHRKKLQMQVDLLEANPDVGMCYGRSERIDERGNTTTYPEGECATTFEAMLRRNPAENCTVVARRHLVEQYYAEVEPHKHPEWLTDDLPMWLWFAANSRYMAIDCHMSVHRVLTYSVSHNPDYGKKIAFVDSLADISLWYDKRYNDSKLRGELLLAKHNTALWVLSYNGSVGEYIRRWWRDTREYRPLLKNKFSYGLFIKKICWRMWRKKSKR
jgi:glycosyltransferase involved in cell wall biosynthesis